MELVKDVIRTSYIPDAYYKDIEHLVFGSYRNVATARIPCLDEDLVRTLRHYFLAVCYYYKYNEALDRHWVEDADLWIRVNTEFSELTNLKELHFFRIAIRQMLDERRMFFEENWVFSGVSLEDPRVGTNNPPLKTIW